VPDKAKWLAIYFLVCLIPLLVFWWSPGSNIVSHSAVRNFLIFAPYIGLTLIAILGWQINQTRIFWTTLFFLGLYYYFLHRQLIPSELYQSRLFEISGVAFPLTLCIIFLTKESRLWSDKSLLRFLLALSPFIVLLALSKWSANAYLYLLHWSSPPLTAAPTLPLTSGITMAFFFLVIYWLPDLKIKPFLTSLMLTLIPFQLAVYFCLLTNYKLAAPGMSVTQLQGLGPSRDFNTIVCFTAITIVLLHAILHMYWKKVYMDILTGVPNRQAMDEKLHNLIKNYCLAMVDIDHFKKFNDTYGHAEGDNVLRMVAQHLEEKLGDRVYRYGGEEFCIIFEGSSLQHAVEMMEKTRGSLEKRKFRLRQNKRRKGDMGNFFTKKSEAGGKNVNITFSSGVASSGKNPAKPEEIIKNADRALYQAKEKGRNRVVADK
jgi:diguanylate cyclase (GGDEF)-like protein